VFVGPLASRWEDAADVASGKGSIAPRKQDRMTRKEAVRQHAQANTLRSLGFTLDEAEALRRISMTLQRWFERECGDSNQWGSWAIERDEDGDGLPYLVHHHYRLDGRPDSTTRTRIPDRESGARRRLGAIITERNSRIADTTGDMTAQTAMRTYVQTDPRGAALYILRPSDVPEGGDPSAYYTRGICVY
jgi:hypothetical protein